MPVSISGTNGVTFPDSSLQTAAASPYVLKNRIINGDMRIDQRNAGASVTINALANIYSVDRWRGLGQSTDGVFTLQQDTSSPAGFVNSLKATVTTQDSSIGATQVYFVSQGIEGFNIADLGWGTANAKTVTLSFWVRSSLTGTFGGVIRNNAVNRAYPWSYTISVANTWEQKSVTIAGDTSGTWLTDASTGIIVQWSLGAGTDRLATAGSWIASNNNGVTGQVQVISTNGATFYITGVQLEQNTSATPFERRLFNQELANCQRYYQQFGGGSGYQYYGTGQATTTTNAYCTVALLTTMRTSPSLAVNSASNFAFTGSANGILAATAIAMDQAGTNACGVSGSVASGLVAGNATRLIANATTSAQMQFSAEL